MLTNHDSTTPVMIGALSEAPEQVKEFGRIAFGGAGIYLSRALFERMNRPGVCKNFSFRFFLIGPR